MAALTIPTIYTAIDKFTAPLKKMAKANSGFAAKAEIATARVNRAFNSMMRPLARVNRMLGGFGLLIGGTLLVGAVSDATRVMMDFQQANAVVASVMSDATIPELQRLQDDAKRLGATTAKSATEVVQLQEAFARLGFSTTEIINMTEATISGSIAMQGELADTAELAGAMVRTFDDFSSIDAPQIIDQLTKSTQKSALNFEKLQTSLPIVAGAANTAGIPFTKLLALLGKLSDAGIDASSSSTALRNIFLESAKQGLNYDQILEKIVSSQDQLTAANDEFGKRAAVSATILAKNIAQTKDLDTAIQNAGGAAEKAAEKQLNTLSGALTILRSSYEGFILSLDDGTGAFSKFLTKVVQVVSEMFSLASGSAKAEETLSEQGKTIRSLATVALRWLKIIGFIVGALLALKAVLFVVNTVTSAYALIVKGVALASKIWTAAQWVLNVALNANPIGLIIIGIAALIGLVTIIIRKYDEWGAALALVAFPIGVIINLIQSFRRNWDMIVTAFKTDGIIGGLKAIGVTILDAILMPLQQVFELLTNVPLIGDFANDAANSIEQFRQGLGVNVTSDVAENNTEPLENVNLEQTRQENLQRIVTEQNQNVAIDINDNTGNATVSSDNDLIPVTLSPTF